MEQRWQDCLQGVQTLADLIQTCQDAFAEDDAAPKVADRPAAAPGARQPVIACMLTRTLTQPTVEHLGAAHAISSVRCLVQVSVTTKKRLTIRAMQGLQGGSALVQVRTTSTAGPLSSAVLAVPVTPQSVADGATCIQQTVMHVAIYLCMHNTGD